MIKVFSLMKYKFHLLFFHNNIKKANNFFYNINISRYKIIKYFLKQLTVYFLLQEH